MPKLKPYVVRETYEAIVQATSPDAAREKVLSSTLEELRLVAFEIREKDVAL